MRAPGMEAHGDEAIRTDAYVEWLLDGADTRPPMEPESPDVDPSVAVAVAARALRDALGRSHPSFRFEERLSRRLAEVAVAMRRAAAVGGSTGATASDAGIGWAAALMAARDHRPAGALVAFPRPVTVIADDPMAAEPLGRAGVHPAVAGGAVASAAISIGAAALVVWRRTHARRGIV